MKDLPHHIKQLNRKMIRSARRSSEEMGEELPEVPTWPETVLERRKKAKRTMAKKRKARVPTGKTPEERNKEMKKGRVPVFDRTNHPKPKRALQRPLGIVRK